MEAHACHVSGCFKVYKSKANLKRHIEAIHAETKKYQCNQCSKVLSSKQNLKEHKFIHSKELPYVCKEIGCGLRFRHGSQYSAHKRIHSIIRNILEDPNKENELKIFDIPMSLLDEIKFDLLSTQKNEEINLPLIEMRQSYTLPTI